MKASYYTNDIGETFTFDENCYIMGEGMNGFSDIPVETTVVNGNKVSLGNIPNGIEYLERTILFNICIKGNTTEQNEIKRKLIHVLTPHNNKMGVFHYVRLDEKEFELDCNISSGYPKFANEPLEEGWLGTIAFYAPCPFWRGEKVTAIPPINYTGDIACGFKASLTDNLINTTTGAGIYAVKDKSLNGYRISTVRTDAYILNDKEELAWQDITVNSDMVMLEPGLNIITGTALITYNPLYLGV